MSPTPTVKFVNILCDGKETTVTLETYPDGNHRVFVEIGERGDELIYEGESLTAARIAYMDAVLLHSGVKSASGWLI